ncbi:MAG: aminotransferase class IV [Firmicutes bacterium]|nr:aminotransferase class IV [Bacillota bacterium]
MKSIINGEIRDNELIDNWKKKGNVYEVLRVINDKPLFLEEHLERLYKTNTNIKIGLIRNEILDLINSYEGFLNDNIFISVNILKNERAIFIIKGFYPPKEWYEKGISINTFNIKRNDPNKKVYDDTYKKIIEKHLKNTGVFETLISDAQIIKEGSRSNVFFIKNDKIFTSSVDAVLPGITRNKVFSSALDNNINIIETNIYYDELKEYEGAFITGTSIDLLPINKIDDIIYNTTEINCFKKITNGFQKIKNKDLEIEHVK